MLYHKIIKHMDRLYNRVSIYIFIYQSDGKKKKKKAEQEFIKAYPKSECYFFCFARSFLFVVVIFCLLV